MKRLTVLLVILVFFVGCPGLQLTETQTFITKKLSRSAGISFAIEQPEDIEKALQYIEQIENIKDDSVRQAAIAFGIKYIYKKYGKTTKTAMLIAELLDTINFVIPEKQGDIVQTINIDTRIINLIVKSFKEGLILAK